MSPRRITAYHESGHAVAMLHHGVWPDAAILLSNARGKVYQTISREEYFHIQTQPRLREETAIASLAGPVAEMMMRGQNIRSCLITSDTGDLQAVHGLGFTAADDVHQIQNLAHEILHAHRVKWHMFAQLLHDIGYLHRDDIISLWKL